MLDQGHELSVWNRTAGRAAELAARGATVLDSPDEVGEPTDAVFLCVADDQRGGHRPTPERRPGRLVESGGVRPTHAGWFTSPLAAKDLALALAPPETAPLPVRPGRHAGARWGQRIADRSEAENLFGVGVRNLLFRFGGQVGVVKERCSAFVADERVVDGIQDAVDSKGFHAEL